MNEDFQHEVRGALGEIVASAPTHDEHPTPLLSTTDRHRSRGRWIASASVAAAAAAAIVVVMVQFNASDTTSNANAGASGAPAGTSASSPPSDEQLIDRYLIDSMAVDSVRETSDGTQSAVFLNTPNNDQDGALPALSIETGTTAADKIFTWPRLGESVAVKGQTVAVRSLNEGDPLAVTWTTSQGTPVTVITEGMTVAGLQDRLEQLRQLTADEWQGLRGPTTLDTSGSTTTTTIIPMD